MSRFDFGKKNENNNIESFRKYFIENKFFGIQPFLINNEAEEFVIWSCNVVVKCEDERKRIELLFGGRKEHDFVFPYSIGVQYDSIYYTQKIQDFAVYIPNSKTINLYVFMSFEHAIKFLKINKSWQKKKRN